MNKMAIIIPVYNSENHISKCLDSVIKQNLYDIEIIVIDDGSTDNSAEIIKSYQKTDNRIKYFYQENAGPGIARNTGLTHCTAEYIAFIDSDDWVEKDFCSKIYQEAKGKNADIVYFNYFEESEKGNIIGIKDISKFKTYDKRTLLKYQVTGKMPWGARSRVIKRSIITNNSIIFSSQRNAEELIFSFKSLYYSQNVIFLSEPLYHYLIRKNSQSRHSDASYVLKEVYKNIKEELKKMGIEKQFTKSLNGLLISSYAIRMYSFTQNNNIIETYKNSLKAYKEYSTQFSDLQYDEDCVDRRVKIIANWFCKGRILPILILGYGYRVLSTLKGRA